MKIRTKLIILLIVTLLFGFTFPLTFFFLLNSRNILTETTLGICENLAKNIAYTAIEELILDNTYDTTIASLRRIKTEGSIAGLTNMQVINREGLIIASFEDSELQKKIEITSELEYYKNLEKISSIEEVSGNKTLLKFTYPIFTDIESVNYRIGVINLWFDKERVFEPLTRLQNQIFLLLVFILILILLIAVYISRLISKPIQVLSEGANIIGSGKLDYRINLNRNDEIGNLANNFNNMTEKLSQSLFEMKTLYENLEVKVQERTKELAIAVSELEKLAESRKRLSMVGEMASGIVHDIKNPMATIKAFAEIVSSSEITFEERAEYMSMILREIDRLSDMTFEILDFSKGNITLNLDSYKVKDFINEIYDFLKMDFEYAEIEFNVVCQFDGEAVFDKDRLRRVLVNMANNAREAMNDRKKKYFFKINSEIVTDGLQFILEDNGPGLPASIEERIFEAFATEGKQKGTGLGLYMSKLIIEQHNGNLSYKTERNQGTIFTIFLPQTNKEK